MGSKLEYEPLIPNGSYKVIYHSHEFKKTFNKDRLIIYFQIAELNDYRNCLFAKWFNLLHFSKNSKGKYHFKVSKRYDFVKFWKLMFPNTKIKRFDRFALSNLKGLIMTATIKASERDYNQKLIDEDLRISKIVELKP